MFRFKKAIGLVTVFSMTLVTLVGCVGKVSTPKLDKGETETKAPVKQMVFKLAENQPDSNPVTVGDVKFSELVEEKTNGEIVIDVYSNAQLGQETETIEQAKAGVLEMARVNTVVLGELVEQMGVFALPYIFNDDEHKYKVLDGEIGEEISKATEDYDLKVLCYLDAGTRHFYTTKNEIKSLEDMKGLKIRVQPAKIALRMVELLGAKPTPMNYGEVYSGLQTGVIDGAENDFVSYKTSSHNEVAKYVALDGHLSPPAVIIMNNKIFKGLSEEHQKAILDAAQEAAEFERKLMQDTNEQYRKEVEESGSVVSEVNKQEFQKAVEPLYEEFPEYKEMIEKIRDVK